MSLIRALLLLAALKPVWACSCGSPPPACAQVNSGAIVFLGIPLNSPDRSTNSSPRLVRFQVQRSFIGLHPASRIVNIDTLSNSSCEALFSVGRRYLVYARSQSDPPTGQSPLFRVLRQLIGPYLVGLGPTMYTTQCMGSRLAQEAAADLRFLEEFYAHRTPTTLIGELYADPDSPNYHLRDRIQRALRGSSVTAVGPDGKVHRAIAGDHGEFKFDQLAPGNYRVSVYQSRLRARRNSFEVPVPPGGCGLIYAGMAFDGRVSGRIREPHGVPATPVKVQLQQIVPGDLATPVFDTLTGAGGVFEFTRLAPGRYLLGVNIEREPAISNPYRPVFYPGAPTREGAVHIQVGEAASVTGLNLPISVRMAPRTISVELIWPDGSPARYVHAWCAVLGYSAQVHELANSDGRIRFQALDGLTYEVGAAAAGDYEVSSRRLWRAKPVLVAPGPSTSIRLILAAKP